MIKLSKIQEKRVIDHLFLVCREAGYKGKTEYRPGIITTIKKLYDGIRINKRVSLVLNSRILYDEYYKRRFRTGKITTIIGRHKGCNDCFFLRWDGEKGYRHPHIIFRAKFDESSCLGNFYPWNYLGGGDIEGLLIALRQYILEPRWNNQNDYVASKQVIR